MADELSTPLGRGKKTRRRADFVPAKISKLPIARIVFAILGVIFVAIIGRLVLVDDPQGGRPQASIDIAAISPTNEVANAITAVQTTNPSIVVETTRELNNGISITTIGDDVPDATTIGSSIGIAALTGFGVLPDLIEETQNGPIPRVGPTGETPFRAYARPSISTQSSDGKPMIAIIVTGMGLSESGTLDAIEKLPDNITLAFAPYGRSLQRTAGAARTGGHELVLEVPLEPFDYPQNDPGPQTLLTGQPPRANLDRLFWLFARFGGYIGTINHMGARFTASAADFGPMMEELGTRGLGYIDDGTSNRSLAGNLAKNNRVPFGRVDVRLDEKPSRTAILEQLAALESRATKNGSAIGIASALPVSIQTIADWAKELQGRDVLLVPISALMSDP